MKNAHEIFIGAESENNNLMLINNQIIEHYTKSDLKKKLFLRHNFEFKYKNEYKENSTGR